MTSAPPPDRRALALVRLRAWLVAFEVARATGTLTLEVQDGVPRRGWEWEVEDGDLVPPVLHPPVPWAELSRPQHLIIGLADRRLKLLGQEATPGTPGTHWLVVRLAHGQPLMLRLRGREGLPVGG